MLINPFIRQHRPPPPQWQFGHPQDFPSLHAMTDDGNTMQPPQDDNPVLTIEEITDA